MSMAIPMCHVLLASMSGPFVSWNVIPQWKAWIQDKTCDLLEILLPQWYSSDSTSLVFYLGQAASASTRQIKFGFC